MQSALLSKPPARLSLGGMAGAQAGEQEDGDTTRTHAHAHTHAHRVVERGEVMDT